MMETSEKNERIAYKYGNSYTDTYTILPNTFISCMYHRSNARIVGVASSELYPPPLPPLLPSLNGSSGIRNAIVGSATTSKNNNNATVARGIINHNNPNSKPNQEEHETRRNGQQQLQSHVLINNKNGIIDFQSVNCSSQSQALQARHIKGDRENNDQVRYNCCSSPPLQSIKDRSALTVGLSFLNAKRSGTLESQKLDSFLDSYERRFGLEPIDINEVHGLSGEFDIASLLKPPQQSSRIVDKQPERHRRSVQVQTFPEKVSQTQVVQSQSHLCSSDLSRLLAATLSDDDIQDKNAKNNNGKDSLSISCKRKPLSPIKEESDSEDKRNAAKAPMQSADSFQETPTMQNGIKDSTTSTKPVTVTIINSNSVNTSNAEVDTSKAISDVTAIKKISNDVSSTPPQQQPQHIDNSKKCNVIGGLEEGNTTVKTKIIENSAAAPKSPIKLLVTSPQSKPPISLTSTNETQHDHRPDPRKSRIPVPLQKTKSNSLATQEVTATASTTSYSLKRCDNDRNISKSSQDVEQKQVLRASNTAVKVQLGNKVNNKSKINLFPTLKDSTLSRRTTPVPIGRLGKPSVSTVFHRNSDSKIRPLKAHSSGKNIGQGDEIACCLSLIDGLSGHTSWVMNKLLECPLPNENAIQRIKRLKECADMGDFFGVPYVSKQILNHTAFQG